MNRTFLRLFYVFVQFVMLAVSIPKVATLFHAYDTETLGPLVAGLDIRSWMVGIVVDLCAVFTTWAAMAKYDESRKRSALLAPAGIILFCSGLSVVANYEDAATLHPEQYARVALFSHPALLVNPLLISAPPILVLLLVVLVPSVLAQPRIKSAEEIAATTAEQVAKINADAEVRKAKATANASVRDERMRGLKGTISEMLQTEGAETGVEYDAEIVDPNEPTESTEPRPPDDPAPATAPAKMTRAMWQAMKLPERVQQSGVITAQEVAEVLGISLTHARNLTKELTTQKAEGRSGVRYTDLIDALYTSRAKNSYAWARRLELALGVKKRVRQGVPTTDAASDDESDESSESSELA